MLGALAEQGRHATFEQLPGLIAEHAAAAGLGQVRIYLADLRGEVLREITGQGLDGAAGGEQLQVDGTLPGRAFREIRTLTAVDPADGGPPRHWLPVLDGTERLGLLSVETTHLDQDMETAFRQLAAVIGLLLVSKRAVSDSYARLIRSHPMTVAAEMQWHLMPPPTFANNQVTIGAAVEPAYEISGDAFDYALAGHTVRLGIFDAMGHDAAAGLCANLAVAACRAHRRQGADLAETARQIERSLLDQFGSTRYATAILADLDSDTGQLRWTSHGHYPPVIIRDRRWIAHLACEPAHPLGTDLGLPTTICEEQLQPGDRLLLYTDGILEARDARGDQFGINRLVQFLIRHQADGEHLQETLRHLMRTLHDFHHGPLQDDATVLILEWPGPVS
ncbi:PP2C family protein-serine/threonine phosphatase [Pseudofrankia asymbiotica]|uniref:Stage II sporulation protein E n=1 Tax=Pseudofrankia asymbiotica TaxID=1834516 RepID=A0A1V2I8T7_9ACTN|nr:PP2C family protein-serine/threonine phosphatase [Pseudofrankia asymbiotica]ONH28789.1 stage II sporulation protein E [Pseudofrankia asymbiotica]